MAAWPESPGVETVDLRELSAGSLDPLLGAETRAWRDELAWDFTASAGLVKRFVDTQSLNGVALIAGAKVIGYTYVVIEDDKGLIGDLFVLPDFATQQNEDKLLHATVDSLMRTSGVRRVETQVILMQHPRHAPPPYAQHLRMFERCFMVRDLRSADDLWIRRGAEELEFENWRDRSHDGAAALLASSYDGHIDSHINDQYRSVAGARRFLTNIVQYPGCGAFQPQASWLAWNRYTGKLCAMSLASLVAFDAGHVTQICVAPKERRHGYGTQVLLKSLRSLVNAECRQASLTVTASNRGAIALYESLGFVTRRRFAAMVWEGFRPARRFF
jgi:ribosomal protein S18 acetylase RimI-like enzyme